MSKNIFIIALLAAVLILALVALKSCGKKQTGGTETIVKSDTAYLPSDTVFLHDTPKLASSTPKPIPFNALPSKSYDSLLVQYNTLARKYYALNRFPDTLEHEGSFVYLNDSVQQNLISGRSAIFSLREKVITNTVTNNITLPAKRQVYIGGGLASINKLEGMSINAGLLYKSRKDNIIGLSIGVDNTGNILYGVNSYWKIRLGK